jgi:hypothetical protein
MAAGVRPGILGQIPMPSEPVIQLPTGYLRMMEALNLLQEHTSIPIAMPEELTPEQVRDILTTARLLRDGVLNSTWTTGTLVLRPEAPDDALEAIGPDSALFIGGDEWVVTIGQEVVPLGPCHRIFFHPQIAGVQALEDGSRRVVFEPAGDGPGRAEERLGPVPGSAELVS